MPSTVELHLASKGCRRCKLQENLSVLCKTIGDPMNIKCSFCQTPYTLSRVEMLDALQEMEARKLNHYDAHCPRCRRATRVERKRMEMFFPNWRDALKQFEA